MNRELPDVQAVLEKAEEPEIKLPTSTGSSKKQESSRKNIYFCFIDYAKVFDCVDDNKLWKILKEIGIPDHLTCLLSNLYAGQEALDMEKQTDSKWEKAVYCHPAYLTSMQSTSWETLDWMIYNLESGRNINNLRDAHDTTLMTESEEELKSLLMKVKEHEKLA